MRFHSLYTYSNVSYSLDLFFRRSQEPVNLGLTVIPSGDSQHLTVASSSRYLGAPLHTISVLTKGKPLGHILQYNNHTEQDK